MKKQTRPKIYLIKNAKEGLSEIPQNGKKNLAKAVGTTITLAGGAIGGVASYFATQSLDFANYVNDQINRIGPEIINTSIANTSNISLGNWPSYVATALGVIGAGIYTRLRISERIEDRLTKLS